MKEILEGLWSAAASALGTIDMAGKMRITSVEIGLVNSFWALIRIVGLGLTVIFFLMEMNRAWLYEGREMNARTFITPFFKLAVAVGVLSVSGRLVTWILQGCNSLIYQADRIVLSDTVSTDPTTSPFGNSVNLWQFISFIIPVLLFVLISYIISFVFLYKALVFKLEFMLRLCATPIAFADIYSGQNSLAVRWAKGLFAMGLYGALLILIPKIGAVYLGGIMAEYQVDGIGIGIILRSACAAIVVPIAEIGAMGVARTVSKEALGA